MARTVRPLVAAGVAAVFLVFMAVAWFVFGSGDAVGALAAAAAAYLVALAPGLLSRTEYRLTDEGAEKRPVRRRGPAEFGLLFAWEELEDVTPTRDGFKYTKRLGASNALVRFARRHLLSGYSGEIHVEPEDRDRVRALLEPRTPGLLKKE